MVLHHVLCPDTPTNYPDWDLNFDGVLDNFNDYENNGSITSKVYDTDGNNISSMGDMVAAFVGSEQRGIGVATSVPVFLGGGYAFLMMVYSNETSGETLELLNIIVLQLMKCLTLQRQKSL